MFMMHARYFSCFILLSALSCFLEFLLYRWFATNPKRINDKEVAAMLDELTIEANEESFVIVLQHGGIDVT